jgi:uncharacterized protein (TIGR02271 family)
MRGRPVYDAAGDKIGTVDEVFYDEDTQQPEWLGIGTGFFGMRRVLVPLSGAEQAEDGLRVPYSKDQVKDSPDIDSDEISQDTEQRLAQHYGVGYSEQRSNTGLPEGTSKGRRGKKSSDDRDVVRSEEELRVGKEQVQTGRARLRKWVETEPVQIDVELKRETARVTREPMNQPVSGSAIGDEEIDVTLREERPVVAKQTVAKERIGLETDVETERQTVTDEVRKERVDIDDDATKRRR